MNPALLQPALSSVFNWTWKTSAEATVLIALVLLVQFAFAKVLSPRWRYGLGLLILLRLLLPVALASPLSIFNLGKRPHHAEVEAPTRTAQAFALPAVLDASAMPVAGPLPAQPSATPMPMRAITAPKIKKISFREMASWVWLSGFTAMLAMLAWQQLNFLRRLGRWDVIREPRVIDMLANCRTQLGMRRSVAVLAATSLNTPALFGIIRPRLLLPVEMVERLDDRELRHVILHELIHLRRGDLLVNWAMIILRAAHWFNPAVWFAFRRLRAEQELACDAAVMARLAAGERRDYGRTLLKLLDDFSPGAPCPGYVPFITSKQIIKRRITMISNFKPAGRLAAGMSIVLLIALGSLTFTRADETNDSADQKNAAPSSSGDQSNDLIIPTADGQVAITVSKDGVTRVGTNMMLTAPAAVTLNKDGTMELTADQMQMVTPNIPSHQFNGLTYSTGATPLRFKLQKDGSIHDGKDGPAMDAAALQKYVEDHAKTVGSINVVVIVEDGNTNVTKQFGNILDALKGRQMGTMTLRYGKDVEALQIGPLPGFAAINPGVAQAMVQSQVQIQTAQADLAADQAAMAYGRARAMQPADVNQLTASLTNQFRDANELLAENIRLTAAKLNDLRNLKETYASDAAEHPSDDTQLVTRLNEAIVEAETQRASKQSLLRQLEQMSNTEQRQALPTTIPDATLDKLMQDELAAEDRLAEQSATTGPNNPEIQATRKMLNKLNLQIDARVKGILDGLRAQVQAADDSIQTLQKELNTKSQRQTELTDLTSQIAKVEGELADLKSQLSGLQDYQGRNTQMAPPSDAVPAVK